MIKTNSALHAQYAKSIEEATQFYDKHKLIIDDYKRLTTKFQKELFDLIVTISKKRTISGKDEIGRAHV